MEKKTKWKIIAGIVIILSWAVLILGVIHVPAIVWLLLVIITFVFYIGATGYTFRRRGSLEDVIDDMENYMEKKAEYRLSEEKKEDTSDEDEDEYDFGDDIEVIKE